MAPTRLKRPKLERTKPIRTWSTLFQAPTVQNGAGAAPPEAGVPGVGPPFADAVEAGYRVIDEYMRQGQSIARGLNSMPSGTGPTTDGPAEMQQLAQRVMQYGWDFVGLWFEMWTKMASATGGGWPPPGAAMGKPDQQGPDPGRETSQGGPVSGPPESLKRMSVSLISRKPTEATVEIRASAAPSASLLVQPLASEDSKSPPILGVAIETRLDREFVTIKVVVPPSQPAGTYKGAIVDTRSNAVLGLVSVIVNGDGET